MWSLIGLTVVLTCVIGGYVALGGKIFVLWQPWEFVIIVGAAVGAFIIGNKPHVIKKSLLDFGRAFLNPKFNKADYTELLTLLHRVLKVARSKGILELEKHIEDPYQSDIFAPYKTFLKNKFAVTFLCDYIRMITMGAENSEHICSTMDEEINTYKNERHEVTGAMNSVADSMPALGIVAAVLGVIKTMGSMSEPPAILGKMIATALIGTFLGVFLAYGFLGPIARRIGLYHTNEFQYLECIRETLLSHMTGSPPPIAIEQARKILMQDVRPTFYELEKAIQSDQR